MCEVAELIQRLEDQLKSENEKTNPHLATLARLKRRIAELELETENNKTNPHPATLARLERRIAELELTEKRIAAELDLEAEKK